MDIFTLVWLHWFFARLENELKDFFVDCLADSFTSGEFEWEEKDFVERVYPTVRAVCYLAWLAQVGFLKADAEDKGVEFNYVPSMRGVSPQFVADIVRATVRAKDGKIAGSPTVVSNRLMTRFKTLVEQVGVDTVHGMVFDSENVRVGSWKYSLKYGQPVERLFRMLNNPTDSVGIAVRERESLQDLARLVTDGYVSSFGSTETYVLKVGGSKVEYEVVEGDDTAFKEAERKLKILAGEKELRKGDLVGYARIPQGTFTCGFCLMLAARGAVYKSDTVLDLTTKTYNKKLDIYYERKKGVKIPAGNTSLDAYHYGCDCKAVPVYLGYSYAGENITLGAEKLWEFAKQGRANYFVDWLNSDEGRKAAKKYVPGLMEASSNYRRRKLRKMGRN